MIESCDGPPTRAQINAAAKFDQQLAQLASEFAQLVGASLAALNAKLQAANLSAISTSQ